MCLFTFGHFLLKLFSHDLEIQIDCMSKKMSAKLSKKVMRENIGENALSGKVKLFERERSSYLRHKFQQVVVQALLKKGEDDLNIEENNENEVEIPSEIETSLNLSKMNLSKFPSELLNRMDKVQYLYLEGTQMTELPEVFFEKLPSLKWLDLRNNSLTSLPNAGLRNHSSLEVILLQGNKIRNLPIELATVRSLRGLQTTGNPLTNIPYDCIASGFSGVMKHLKKLWSQNDILVSTSEMVVVKPSTSQDSNPDEIDPGDSEIKTWDVGKLSQWRQFIKRKSKAPSPDVKYFASQSGKLPSQKPKVSVTVRAKVSVKPAPFRCGIYNKNRRKSAAAVLQHLKMRKTRLGYKRKPITTAMLEEKASKESYLAQLRETLEKQARKIQRMRDKEVLKAWRDHSRHTRQQLKLLDNYQSYPSKDFANKTPFDVDPDFLNMLNRVDLYRSLKDCDSRSKKVKKPKIRITAFDLERQMNDIIQKLRNLDASESDETHSPRTKESHMSNKISKILDIQKTLKHLQTLNSSMSGITPLPMSKNPQKN